MTPDLHRLARMNRLDELSEAVTEGGDMNKKDEFGLTPLHCAIAEHNIDVASFLINNGADVVSQDNDGKTPLHYSIEHNLPAIAESILTKCPAAHGVSDKHGNEPLWTAAMNAKGEYQLVLLLLRYGANPEHRNRVNLTPLDIPKRKKNDRLLAILQSKAT